MKLNLGCGFDKRDGWLNVDSFAECEPDVLMDIETVPWPLDTGAFEHVLMKHVLEHVGAEFKVFAAVMRELHRVAEANGRIEIHVPHVRHDTFWSDPTHVRAFTPLTFQMMSRRQNREWMARRANYTMLAFVMDVDFELEAATQVYDPAWWSKVERGELTKEQLRVHAERDWGVAKELQIVLRAVK